MRTIQYHFVLCTLLICHISVAQIKATQPFPKQKKISGKFLTKNKIPVLTQKGKPKSTYKSGFNNRDIDWSKTLKYVTQLKPTRYIGFNDVGSRGKKVVLNTRNLEYQGHDISAFNADINSSRIKLKKYKQGAASLPQALSQGGSGLRLYTTLEAGKKYLVTFLVSTELNTLDLKLDFQDGSGLITHTYPLRKGKNLPVDFVINAKWDSYAFVSLYAIGPSLREEAPWHFIRCTIQEVQL